MKIFEIFSHNPQEAFAPDFNLGEDLQFFIHNDPEFYRKHYFPFIIKLKEAKQNKTKFTAKAFEALVKHAYNVYTDKFSEEELPTTIDDKVVKEVCENLYREEIKNIEEGHYDDIK
jgi:hypothetical protein